MSAAPLVSVVMPVHNGARFLSEAVESVLGQTFPDFELVVIDDGSSDETPRLLERYGDEDERVRVHRHERAGLVASLNTGCALARGRYVARMDADDVSRSERLERQVAFLSANPDVALLGTGYVVVDASGRELHTASYPTENARLQATLKRKNCFAHPTVVFDRRAFEDVGGYRRAFLHAEDYDLWLRLAERHAVANLPDPLVAYRVHVENVTLRNVRQQMTSTLAARAAAERRSRHGDDGMDEIDLVTPEVLARLGVPAQALERDVADACLNWAKLAFRMGAEDASLRLIEEGVASARSSPSLNRQRARGHRIRAAVHFRRGRRRQGARSLLAAFSAEPSLPARIAWQGVCAARDRLRTRSSPSKTPHPRRT